MPTPKGLIVQTTIRKADQEAAYAAVRRGVIDYDHRHGYRGPEAYLRLRRTPPSATPRWSASLPRRTTATGSSRPS
jgi:penicillin-binding protein 1A